MNLMSEQQRTTLIERLNYLTEEPKAVAAAGVVDLDAYRRARIYARFPWLSLDQLEAIEETRMTEACAARCIRMSLDNEARDRQREALGSPRDLKLFSRGWRAERAECETHRRLCRVLQFGRVV